MPPRRGSGRRGRCEVWLYQDPPPALADPSLWSLEQAAGRDAGGDRAPPRSRPLRRRTSSSTLAGLPDPARYRLVVEPPASVAFDPLRTWLPARLRPECPDLGACFDVGEPPPPPPPSPVLDYRPRDWRALRQALVEYAAAPRPGRGRLDRRPDDHRCSSSSRTSATCSTTASTGSRPRLPGDGAAAHLGAAARAPRRLRRRRRRSGGDVRPRARRPERVHRDRRRGQRGGRRQRGSDLAFTLEADLAADARLGGDPDLRLGRGGVLPPGRRDRVRARPSARGRPAGRRVAGRRRPARLRGRRPRRRGAPRELGAAVVQLWPTDAGGDPRFRAPLPSRVAQVVRLTEVAPFADPLLGAGLALFRVRWAPEDALARPYPVGVDTSAGEAEVTVARGEPRPRPPRAARRRPARDDARASASPTGPIPRTLRRASSRSSLRAAPGAAGARAARASRSRRPAHPTAPSRRRTGSTSPFSFRPASPCPPPGSAACSTRAPASTPSSSTPRSRSRRSCASRPARWAWRRRSARWSRPPTRSAAGRAGTSPANALAPARGEHEGPGAAAELAGGRRRHRPQPGRGESAAPTRRRSTSCGATPRRRSRSSPRRAVLPADHAAAVADDPLVQRAMAQRAWSGSWPVIATVVDLEVGGCRGRRGSRPSCRRSSTTCACSARRSRSSPGPPSAC